MSDRTGAAARVAAAYARLRDVDRPEVWVTLRPEREASAAAAEVDARAAAGEDLPLAGLVLAVKDNVDVAGMPTTAGCPAFAYEPALTAPAVRHLTDAGAVVLGKANLDQFATGLVGTRSPYGAVRGVPDPARITGGSSSGSAAAVALGVADVGVATDTAGSGRVPAALTGIIGVKPTRGLVPADGVVPASRPHDCLSVLARDLRTAVAALGVMIGTAPDRPWPADVRLAAPPGPRVAVPADSVLAVDLDPARHALFTATIATLEKAGAEVVTIDVTPFLRAAALMYDSALVAERHAAVGAFVAAHPREVDPTVGTIVAGAGTHSGADLATAYADLAVLRRQAEDALAECDALLLPTTPSHPTVAEVAGDPFGVNRRLGTYTNFLNLVDMAGVAVPAGTVEDGGAFGVTVAARAFDDQVAIDVAAMLIDEPAPALAPTAGLDLVVFGAHMRGQPLNHQLTSLGARFGDEVVTTRAYRMYALPTSPPKPAVVAVGPGRGGPLRGERWRLSPGALGTFLATLPPPMALGPVTLADGTTPTGFLAPASAAANATDITPLGGWLAHLASP